MNNKRDTFAMLNDDAGVLRPSMDSDIRISLSFTRMTHSYRVHSKDLRIQKVSYICRTKMRGREICVCEIMMVCVCAVYVCDAER